MSLATRAGWTIERNLNQPLSLDWLAEACGVSRFHLAHAFGDATGRSVMRYVRSRRLSEAAKNLAKGAPDILRLALDTGYSSNEAFSRAFRDQFGVPPEAVRKAGATAGLPMTEALNIAVAETPPLGTPRIERAGAQLFVGLQQNHGFEDLKAIPGQWERFMQHYDEIDDKADPIPWGLCLGVDDEGRFDYLCAVKVSAADRLPKGLIRTTTAPHTYAIFQHREHVSRLYATYSAIWNDWLPTSGRAMAEAPCLEQHCETFDTRTGYGGVDIWIPLAD
jgi:AraC family transcriptional regulator